MNAPRWDIMLEEARKLHALADVAAFCPLPDDISPKDMAPVAHPACDAFVADDALHSEPFAGFRDVLKETAKDAHWRYTYQGTDISEDFINHFGCFELIGYDAPFASSKMRSFMVYQPAHFHYPWHHHPADEMYVVLAGEAEFHREGHAPEILRPGQVMEHKSNQPHALSCHDSPVLAYVMWRNHFDSPPVWTYPEDIH